MAGTSPSGKAASTPANMPEGTPSLASPSDHSWTLQAVMQMQRDLGVLGEKIDRMRGDFGDLKADGAKTRDQLAEVEKSIASAKGALKVFGSLYALLLVVVAALLAWFLRPAPTPTPATVGPTQVQPAAQPATPPKSPAG